jgi:hypothetical protein
MQEFQLLGSQSTQEIGHPSEAVAGLLEAVDQALFSAVSSSLKSGLPK